MFNKNRFNLENNRVMFHILRLQLNFHKTLIALIFTVSTNSIEHAKIE